MSLEVFLKVFNTFIFLDILDSIVSISKGSAAAKKRASTSLSPHSKLEGKLTTLLFFLSLFIIFL